MKHEARITMNYPTSYQNQAGPNLLEGIEDYAEKNKKRKAMDLNPVNILANSFSNSFLDKGSAAAAIVSGGASMMSSGGGGVGWSIAAAGGAVAGFATNTASVNKSFRKAKEDRDRMNNEIKEGFKKAREEREDGFKKAEDGFKKAEEGFKKAKEEREEGFKTAREEREEGFKKAKEDRDRMNNQIKEGFKKAREEREEGFKAISKEFGRQMALQTNMLETIKRELEQLNRGQ
eukprot:scaffold6632_cov102-Cylindrotheca_fusiformis.AAC.6